MNVHKIHDNVINNKTEIIKMYKNGISVRQIATKFNTSVTPIYKILHTENVYEDKTTKWTDEIDKFLIENAPIRGSKYCMEKLNIGYYPVKHRCEKLKIPISYVDFGYNVKSKIVELYKSGLKNTEISKIVNKDKGFITKVVIGAGIYKRPFAQRFKWNEKLEKQLVELYKTHTVKECAKIMGIPRNAIAHRILSLETEKIYQDPVNMNLFYNITLPEIAYFLGFCYADGSIRGREKRVAIGIVVEDARELKDCFSKLGKYCYYEYDKSHLNRRTIGTFHFNSHGLWQFLYEHDYYEKSTRSADKILSKIPDNLKHYFFRGFLDGDGHIQVSKDRNRGSVSFCGSYEQDWHFMEVLLKNMDINYRVSKQKQKSKEGKIQRRSTINICGLDKVLKFLNYIYQDRETDKIGLPRKYDKFLILKEKTKNFINNMGGIYISPTCINKYRICMQKNFKKLPYMGFSKLEDAIEHKKNLIKEHDTKEYRLRKLINYWDFTIQFQHLTKN